MTISVGDKLPDVTFKTMTADGPADVSTAEVFADKKVVLFAVPGAFTPTCHQKHLPGFMENLAAFKAKGVDVVACTAVNDVFVMNAWAKANAAEDMIAFLADGNGEFAKALGLDLDATGSGLGIRSRRYAMLVEDGVVKILNVEEVPSVAEKSSAQALLEAM